MAWPIFKNISGPLTIVAFFSRKLEWKKIPHKDTTTFELLNEPVCKGCELPYEEKENIITDVALMEKEKK